MPAARRELYELLAELVEYPGPGIFGTAERARAQATARDPEAAAGLERFAAFVAGADERELEELYTRTFDVCAPCCLDVGYQLFGETYKRGSFLVKLRVATREHGVDPGSELPDHLAPMLRLLGRLAPEEDPRGLVEEALLPALEKMLVAFGKDADSPYRALIAAVAALLAADFALSRPVLPPEPVRLPIASLETAP